MGEAPDSVGSHVRADVYFWLELAPFFRGLYLKTRDRELRRGVRSRRILRAEVTDITDNHNLP